MLTKGQALDSVPCHVLTHCTPTQTHEAGTVVSLILKIRTLYPNGFAATAPGYGTGEQWCWDLYVGSVPPPGIDMWAGYFFTVQLCVFGNIPSLCLLEAGSVPAPMMTKNDFRDCKCPLVNIVALG